MDFKLTNDQDSAFANVKEFMDNDEPVIVIKGSAGTGKCLGYDTPVMMFNGQVKMVQDIIEGELIMGDDSTPRTVLSTSFGQDDLYKVSTRYEDSYIVNSHHILTFYSKQKMEWNGPQNCFEITWGDIDGHINYKRFTRNQKDEGIRFINELPRLVDIPITECIKRNSDEWRDYFQGVYTLIDFSGENVQELDNDPYEYGCKSCDSFIPHMYKFNSYENRLKLFNGLLAKFGNGVYEDDYKKINGFKCQIKNESSVFIDDITFLSRSLGFKVIRKHKYCVEFRLYINNLSDDDTTKCVPVANEQPVNNFVTSPITIEQIGRGDYYGFELDGNKRFVLGNFIITHNTTLTQYITDYAVDKKHLNVVAVAPTHKARRVMEKMLNKERFIPIPTMTVASILGKLREHSYIGSHKYSNGSKQKMDRFDLILIDEVSMVSDKDLDSILDYICINLKKVILIGDDCQIPCPSQHLIKNNHVCYKPDSSAFEIIPLCHLTEIVRQASESQIVKLATYLRDHILQENNLTHILSGSGIERSEICIDHGDLYDFAIEDIKQGLSTRIVSYTNASVRTHNNNIRNELGYKEPYVLGELLTGYNNVGFPVPIIENGTDYIVKDIKYTDTFSIREYTNLSGYLIKLQDVDDSANVSYDLFFILVKHSANALFMKELVRRAEKVNQRGSTKDDFRKYCQLKNGAIFLEDVYKYGKDIMTETNLKQLQPLLFTKASEVINIVDKQKVRSELALKLEDMYGDIIECRLCDNKPFADGEVFADQYMVVEKDIYYGYSITSHKSQGSTYESVYVDENDFEKISNKWNYKFRAIENRHKEKNQLKYVAYTRASKKLKIVV